MADWALVCAAPTAPRWTVGGGVLLAHGVALALAWQASSALDGAAVTVVNAPPGGVLYLMTAPPAMALPSTTAPATPPSPLNRAPTTQPRGSSAITASVPLTPSDATGTEPTAAAASAASPSGLPVTGPTPAVHHGEDRGPRALANNPLPIYPPSAREDGLEGIVGLTVELSAQGQVVTIRWAHRSGQAVLDQAARDAVRAWRFSPALRDGVAVAGTLTLSIHFRLNAAQPASAIVAENTP